MKILNGLRPRDGLPFPCRTRSGEVDRRKPSAASGLEPFLGLHYPASDIPEAGADSLPAVNWLRLIIDVGDINARPAIVDRDLDATARRVLGPVDERAPRAVSPIHVEYLRNMGVARFDVGVDPAWTANYGACSPATIHSPRHHLVRSAAPRPELFGQMFSMDRGEAASARAMSSYEAQARTGSRKTLMESDRPRKAPTAAKARSPSSSATTAR